MARATPPPSIAIRNARPRVPLTNEYSFLGPIKGAKASYFRIRTDFSRSLFERVFCGGDQMHLEHGRLTIPELSQSMQQFRERFGGASDLLSQERVKELHHCFCRAISNFRTFATLMSEIQNEYALVIKAIGNILDEKAFLRSKINKLMVEHATRDALETERARIVDLVAAWDVASRWKRLIELQTTKEELAFVSRVGDLFPLELSKKQPEKRRKDLQYLGRWHFVKDWVEERAQTCPVLMQLSEKLKQNPAVYKRLFPEDEGIGAHEYDAPEVRKLKHHVEEQRRISRNYAKELAAVNEKYRVLYAQINNVDERIKEVSELLSTRFGAVRTVDSDEPNDRESAVQ